MAVRLFLSAGGQRTVDAADSARLDGPFFPVRRWHPDLNRTETVLTLRSEEVIGAEVLKEESELTTFRGAGRPRHEPSHAATHIPLNHVRVTAAMISASEALERLREGNRRFVSDVRGSAPLVTQTRRSELAEGQEPFAIILGCSDSRVPAEIVFDQGLVDLFVIRVAGNIVASSQIGSVEFAAERFGTPLVVVLGHSRCGAVLATLEELMRPREKQSRNLRSIVDRIRPSVEGLLATELRHDSEALVQHAVRANIRASANQVRHGSEVLEELIQKGRVLVVGAEYSLETGVVDFFDGVPEAG